tara:strand:- start:822 stop:1322 length:501 start_codon:yes stop_codon:yes gene_type:complete
MDPDKIVIKNVLTSDQRKRLIKECKPYLKDFGEDFPGRQSSPLLFNHPQFKWAHKLFHEIASKELRIPLQWDCSFFNETNGNKKSIMWHNHPVDYVGVYYMKIPFPFFSNGTLFEEGLVKAPQNSLLLFPGHIRHTCPTSPLRFKRYTMALNWNKDSLNVGGLKYR